MTADPLRDVCRGRKDFARADGGHDRRCNGQHEREEGECDIRAEAVGLRRDVCDDGSSAGVGEELERGDGRDPELAAQTGRGAGGVQAASQPCVSAG